MGRTPCRTEELDREVLALISLAGASTKTVSARYSWQGAAKASQLAYSRLKLTRVENPGEILIDVTRLPVCLMRRYAVLG